MATVVVLLGFAALTVDVGVLYNVRAELQNAADAGAMAAANSLMTAEYGEDPLDAAQTVAQGIVERHSALGRKLTIDPAYDVQFGKAVFDPDLSAYTFTPGGGVPDAVRVTVRCTEDSPNGPVGLFFAPIFGKTSTNISASAVAALAPRDIAMAADLSGSMRYDSQLKYYDTRTINFHEVWDVLPGGAKEFDSTWEEDELPADLWQAAGPGWGYFKRLTFGSDPADSGYGPTTDPGLIRLTTSAVWNDASLGSYLAGLGYSVAEISAITSPAAGSLYENRVAVAGGLAYWNSGMPGGSWTTRGVPPAAAGNGNATITNGELQWVEPILSDTIADSSAVWRSYIPAMTSSSRGDFRYRFGIKTFVEYLIESRIRPDQTPEFAATPLQPLQAVKDSVGFMSALLDSLESADQMSLECYGGIGVHEVDLTSDYQAVSKRLSEMRPGEYSSYTNIGAGLDRAIEELTSSRARATSHKVIVLLTDGYANVDEFGDYNEAGAKAYALREAERAARLGMTIIGVTVGQEADEDLMREIAEIGGGAYFHAEGSIDEYSEQLVEIFGKISSKRSVELIQ
jgi:Flp pilus assembly protein TadG